MTLEDYLRQFGSGFSAGPLLALPVALLGGVVAGAVCPCTLPVGLGIAGAAGASETQSRRSGFMIAAAFFAGIVLNLTILGALASRLGGILTESFGRYWTLAMALLSLIAAILAFWGPRLKTDQLAPLRKPGIAGAGCVRDQPLQLWKDGAKRLPGIRFQRSGDSRSRDGLGLSHMGHGRHGGKRDDDFH